MVNYRDFSCEKKSYLFSVKVKICFSCAHIHVLMLAGELVKILGSSSSSSEIVENVWKTLSTVSLLSSNRRKSSENSSIFG